MSALELTLVCVALVLYGPVITVSLINMLFWKRNFQVNCDNVGTVSVLIPARNEAANLDACVMSVLSQGDSVTEVIIYNDGSTDDTQQILNSLISRFPSKVKQAKTARMPAGWVGKTHACDVLAREARADWILFLDADARLSDRALDTLVSEASGRNATLLSAWPLVKMRSFSEKALMPLLNFTVFALFPAPLSQSRPAPGLGLAHGACILAQRQTYLRLGGHSLVKHKLFEDTTLARIWRERGENSQVIDGRDIVSVRMYSSFRQIWAGFSKNYYPAFGSIVSFAVFQTYLLTAYIVVPTLVAVLAMTGTVNPAMSLIAAVSLAPRFIIAVMFRHSLWSAAVHPVSMIVMMALGAWSWWICAVGGGVKWKGRRYTSAGIVVDDE